MKRYVVLCLGMIALASPALADKASYCQAYARDFSDQLAKDKVTWQHKYQIALDACLGSPAKSQTVAAAPAKPAPAPPAAKPPVKTQEAAKAPEPAKPAEVAAAEPKPAPKKETKEADGGLTPGSAAWNEYCARKYTSFNPKNGQYLSHTGVMRRCLYTG